MSKIHISWITRGGKHKVLDYSFSSPFTGRLDTYGKRPSSYHAEDRCLSRRRKIPKSCTIYSIAFSFISGAWIPAMAMPCLNCSRTIERVGIRRILYSDYAGNLNRISIGDLLKRATFSVGYSIQRGVSDLIPNIFLKTEQTMNYMKKQQKTVVVRLYRGLFSQMKVGMKVRFLVQTSSGTMKTLIVAITRLKKYSNFRNLLVKEGIESTIPGASTIGEGVSRFRQLFRGKFKAYDVLAIHFIAI